MMEYVDGVDQPAHYGGKDYPYQPIHVIQAWGLNFCVGTAVKYIGRAGKKPGESYTKDLQKAIWYLRRELEQVEDEREYLRRELEQVEDEREVRSQPQQSTYSPPTTIQSRHQQEIIERRNAIAHKMDIPDVEVIAEDESQSEQVEDRERQAANLNGVNFEEEDGFVQARLPIEQRRQEQQKRTREVESKMDVEVISDESQS